MTVDEMKLARDGHLLPLSVVGRLPKPPRRAPSRSLGWAILRADDGTPRQMNWLGVACRHRSAAGFYCDGPAKHEGRHASRARNWAVTWADAEAERFYDVASFDPATLHESAVTNPAPLMSEPGGCP